MVDYVKLEIKDLTPEIWLDSLEFTQLRVEGTNAPKGSRIAECRGLKFIISPYGKMMVEGSLHKFANFGRHNFDQFSVNRLALTIRELKTDFGIDPTKAILHNIEFGVNMSTGAIPVDKILRGLLLQQGKEFKYMSIPSSNFKECLLTQYFIKAYDKCLQYGLAENLFRWEIKASKMQCLNGLGLRNLADLMQPGTLEALGFFLLKRWDSSLFVYPSPEIPYPSANWSNPWYWIDLQKSRPRQLSREKELLEIFESQLSVNVKGLVRDLIVSGWFDLTTREAVRITERITETKPMSESYRLSIR